MRRHKEVTAKGLSVCGCGHLGRRVGTERGLQHDDRRRQGAGRVSAAYLRDAGAGKDFGWGHVGPGGAGHFVKMVHNGIEYGLMQAYAEGFTILEKKKS
jgi:6-phosphogluconate dehydrogenase